MRVAADIIAYLFIPKSYKQAKLCILLNDYDNLSYNHVFLFKAHGQQSYTHGHLLRYYGFLFKDHGHLFVYHGQLKEYHGHPLQDRDILLHYHGKRMEAHGNLLQVHGNLLQTHGNLFIRLETLFHAQTMLLQEHKRNRGVLLFIERSIKKLGKLYVKRPIFSILKSKMMKVQITLKQRKQSNLSAIYNAEHFIGCITGNPLFLAPEIVAQLARVVTAYTNLHTEIAAAISEFKGDHISAAREVLDREVTNLKNMIEGVANKPEILDSERLGIIHSAGMSDKAQASHTARVFKAINGEVSGTIVLLARGGAKSNEWQYTTDTVNFTGRIALKTTTKAMIVASGLPINTPIACFHKPIMVGVDTDWEGPVNIMVV